MKESEYSADTALSAKTLSEADIRAALGRISASQTFSASPRLTDFLRYVSDVSVVRVFGTDGGLS